MKMLKIEQVNEFVVMFFPSYLYPQNYMQCTQDQKCVKYIKKMNLQ